MVLKLISIHLTYAELIFETEISAASQDIIVPFHITTNWILET